MNADEIAKKLAAKPKNAEECIRLIRACEPRRMEIEARIGAIAEQANLPPERVRAMRSGLAAVEALDREEEALRLERRVLDQLEHEANAALEALHEAAVRPGIQLGLQRLPGAVTKVSNALGALDAALAELNASVEAVNAYVRFPDLKMPLSPDDAVALIRLRYRVWQVRAVEIVSPPEDLGGKPLKGYELAWKLCFDARGGRITTRRPGDTLPDELAAA